ncbi:MAG: CHC2 zinc finger domain-containing protein [Oscillospiraceae bacterium]|nr:CHC2 zinc finger domain-containing protein [Oscillospiraceae bacterium]
MAHNFAFDISDIAAILNMQAVRRNSASMDVNCPFCGDRRGKMNINFEKNVFRCNYCGESGGMLGLYAKYMRISNSDAYREICEILRTPGYSARRTDHTLSFSREKPQQKATPEQIHQTYTALLSMLSLSKQHRENLISRGLANEQIEQYGFRNTPITRIEQYPYMLIERGCTLCGVPGFYLDKTEQKWKMKMNAKCSGIVIPVVTVGGLTSGVQIRLDTSFNGCKYLWFSSASENMGVSCGSPVGFVGNMHYETVYVTEGYLKAVIAHCLSDLTFAAVAGANNYRNLADLFAVLKQNGVKEIVEAYDMDKMTNVQVEKGCWRLVELANEYGFKVRRITWDSAYKGIDDYLYSLKY